MTELRTRHQDGGQGFGLIELVVAIFITGILLVAIGTIFVRALRTQEEVTSVNQATNGGQMIGSMIERAMRNALFVETTGDTLLVRTSFEGSSLHCQGIYIGIDGARFATSATSVSGAWGVWKPSVKAAHAGPYFQLVGDQLTYSFDVDSDGVPVTISGQVQPRSEQETGNGGCW